MLRVIPLGGLGEIGLNSMLVECRGEHLLIDCGLMFPTAAMHGVGMVVPDFGYLLAQRERLRGIVLTHGHEDHVGALPSLLREVSVPVYGTRFTLALVRSRLAEQEVAAELRELCPGERVQLSRNLEVEAFRVVHSMPDAVGLIVTTPEGRIIHTGDFKLDEVPIDGHRTDLERLGEVGEEGVLCLLSDSTATEFTTETPPERLVAERFETLFAQAGGRIIVSLFASNMHRVRHTLELCARTGRRVVLLGRSLLRNVEVGRQLGYFGVPSSLFIAPEEAQRLSPRQVAILSTGAQAEPRSALAQMLEVGGGADGGRLRVGPGDLVILSSRAIPGNEREVAALLDRIYARGATAAYGGTDPGVHVSGHASRPQQRRVLETVRPQHFVPIHGELRHLHRHADLAREVGISKEAVLLAQDGDVVQFEDGRGRLAGAVPVGRIFLDRSSDNRVLPEAIAERDRLADSGVVFAALVLQRGRTAIVSGPHLTGKGLTEAELEYLSRAGEAARQLLDEISPVLFGDEVFLREEVSRAVRRVIRQATGRRPVVVPLLVYL
jgi:ribonuclease J